MMLESHMIATKKFVLSVIGKKLVETFGKVADGKFVDVKYDQHEEPRFKIYKMMQESSDSYVLIYRYDYMFRYITEFSKSRYRKFYKSKESLPTSYASLWYLASFPYKEYFNRKITLLHAMGLPDEINDRFATSMKLMREKYLAAKDETGLITLNHLFAGFLCLLVGYLVALVGFFLECCSHKLQKPF